MHDQRPVVARLHVIFATAHNFHRDAFSRCIQGLGNVHRLHQIFARRHRAATETAAGHLHMNLDLLELEATRFGDCGCVNAGHLRRGVHVATVRLQIDGAGDGLHLRVVQIREHKLSGEVIGRTRQFRHVGAHLVAGGEHAFRFGQRLVLFEQGGGIGLVNAGRIPLNLQCVAAHLRRPIAVGDDSDAACAAIQINWQHSAYALHFLRCRRIKRFELCAKHRRPRDHRRQHARQLHINAIFLLTRGFRARYFEACWLAD